MLKHKSALLGLAVLLNAGFETCGLSTFATAEEFLLDSPFEVTNPATGNEKASGDQLPAPGVSFPTRFYASHASAYRAKMVKVELVNAGKLPEIFPAGSLKSSLEHPCEFPGLRPIAQIAAIEESAAETPAVAVVTEAGFASLPNFYEDVPESDDSKVTETHSQVPQLAELSLATEVPELAEMPDLAGFLEMADTEVAEQSLQPVVYQDESIPPVPPAVVESISPSLQEGGTEISSLPPESDNLFRCLNGVELKNAIRTDDQLPDGRNGGREYFRKAGIQHNWSSGTWVSFRPKRNTFPFHNNPLYFEDPNLERCGLSCGCLTEITSIVHFAGRIPALPYMMTVEPPCSLVRGKADCPTCSSFGADAYFPQPEEIDLGGVAVQSAMTVGLIFLIP